MLYQFFKIVRSALHFTPWQTYSIEHLNFLGEHSALMQLKHKGRSFVHKYPPLFMARYSLTQLSELEQCRVKELVQGSQSFKMAAQDLNLCSLDQGSDALTPIIFIVTVAYLVC